MRRVSTVAGLILGLAVCAGARPTVTPGGVLNAASYSRVGLPNSSLAQGGMFVAFGSELGPVSDLSQLVFPLTTNMLGTSIQVTVGGTNVQALMIYTTPSQIAGILPSNTPTGTGTFRVTVNGETSDPVQITVVRSSFGIFTRNSAGSGPAIMQRFVSATELPLVDALHPASPGQVMILWGTGLGPAPGDEAGGPIPGDLNSALGGVEVFVGTEPATVTYAGRSGCCAGIDQVIFTMPANISGCYVALAVRVNGVVSNVGTIAVAAPNQPCSDPNGLSAADFGALETQESVRLGVVDLSRFQISVPVGSTNLTITSDNASGSFGRYTGASLAAFRGVTQTPSLGSCAVSTFLGLDPLPVDPILPTFMDAGANLSITGPRGNKQAARVSTGVYAGTLGGIALDQILTGTPIDPYLDPGTYTISGAGGADVGAFSQSQTLPATINWTNSGQISAINRNTPLNITWTGGSPSGFVLITGLSVVTAGSGPTDTSPGAAFACVARADAGQFTVPTFVLQALPATTPGGLFPSAFLLVGSNGSPVKFTAPNLDAGYLTYRSQSGKAVTFQ